MSERTLERQPNIEHILAEEQKALRDIQLIRDQQEMEGLNDRVLQFEDSGGIRIVSYNEYQKETVSRDSEGKEQVNIETISLDEKNELDNMYEMTVDYEEMNTNDTPENEHEKDIDDGFFRDEIDEIDRDDEMEYGD